MRQTICQDILNVPTLFMAKVWQSRYQQRPQFDVITWLFQNFKGSLKLFNSNSLKRYHVVIWGIWGNHDPKCFSFQHIHVLFNIYWEARLKRKMLNFAVCVVWWCSDGSINSQEKQKFKFMRSLSMSIFTSLKHLMMLLKWNFFRASFLHLIKDTDGMLGTWAQIFKSVNIIKQCL